MSLIEAIIEAILTSSRVWVGALVGVMIAVLSWYILPESVNRSAIGAWAVGIGIIAGWIFTFQSEKDKE